jgi:rubrerythrin
MPYTNTPQETGFEHRTGVEFPTGYEREKTENLNPSNDDRKNNEGFNYDYLKSSEIMRTGQNPGKGTYSCTNCGTDITLNGSERLPACPRCGNTEFRTEN